MRRTRNIVVATLFVALAQGAAQAATGDTLYCDQRRLGFYFYCEKPAEVPDPDSSRMQSDKPLSAVETIDEIRGRLDELRATAILEPTVENITAYVRYQRTQLDRASTFADAWQRAVWQSPDLDYTLQRPVGHLAKQVWKSERQARRAELLSSLGDQYGLFYLYAEGCGACRAFSPVLRAFSDRYRIPVKAVSLDGGPNPYFPNAVADTGQVAALGLSDIASPAVILFEAATRKVIPVSYGLVSEQDLAERIVLLVMKGIGDDF